MKSCRAKHQLKVTKGGFQVFTKSFMLDANQPRHSIRVHLDSLQPAATMIAPPQAAPATPTAPSTLAPATDAERRATEWVLERGGKLTVLPAGGKLKDISARADIPTQAFTVENIDLGDCQGVDDQGLANLAELEHLKSLVLRRTQISDAGTAPLSGLASLRRLALNMTGIGDQTLAQFAGLTNLHFLDIGETQVTDAGLAALPKLPALEILGLKATQISDAGLAALSRCPALKSLNLDHTKISDAGLAHLRSNIGLQFLNLDSVPITDRGVAELVPLTQLRDLILGFTKVTDAAVANLGELKNLSSLNLKSTAISQQGVARLQSALPKCKIAWSALANASAAPANPLPQNQFNFERQLAEEVLGMGGRVDVSVQGGPNRRCKAVAELPREPFVLTEVWLWRQQNLSPALFEKIGRLAHLRDLNLDQANVTEGDLQQLLRLESLQMLRLGSVPIGDAGLQQLARLTNLQLLNLTENSAATAAGVAKLQAMLPNCKVKWDLPGASAAAPAGNDRAAAVWALGLGGKVKISIGGQRTVEVKDAAQLPADDFRIINLSLYRKDQVRDTDLAHLRGLSSLVDLNLLHTQTTDEGLANLAGLTGLESLNLDATRVTGPGLHYLSGLQKLTKLILTETPLADSVPELASLMNLTELAVNRSTLSDLNCIRPLKRLQNLHLGGSQVSDLAVLEGLTELTNLDVYKTKISDQQLVPISGRSSNYAA